MNIVLTGKNALVCGSTQGIGKAVAFALAELGASVTLFARDKTALKQVCRKLPVRPKQQHDFLVADFMQPEQVQETIADYVKKKTIHILVNNTGGPPAGQLLDAQPEDFLLAYRMHLICNHILVQAIVPGMKKARYGRIINIISTSVRQPIKGLGVSNTTRGAVASWAKTLSMELGPFGITVNNILPGFTNTERLKSLLRYKAGKENKSTSQLLKQMLAEVPLGRLASPEEIAAVVAFLATPAASYVNGASIPVDGGRTTAI